MTDINKLLSEAEANTNDDNAGAYEITCKNQLTGAKDSLPIFGDNSLGQILEGVAAGIGINQNNKKVIFTNERTKKSTGDQSMLAADFGLTEGDCLGITDGGHVA